VTSLCFGFTIRWKTRRSWILPAVMRNETMVPFGADIKCTLRPKNQRFSTTFFPKLQPLNRSRTDSFTRAKRTGSMVVASNSTSLSSTSFSFLSLACSHRQNCRASGSIDDKRRRTVLCAGFFKKGWKGFLGALQETAFLRATVQNAEEIELHVKRIVVDRFCTPLYGLVHLLIKSLNEQG
jgi:hypothetical protein